MKKYLVILVTAVIVALTGNCYAAHNKPEEAKALVKKAISFLKANGKEKAFAEFNDPKGQFVKGELYLFAIDLQGHMIAHGANPKLVGKSMLDFKDADGVYFVQEFIKAAKKGGGWVQYKWINPVTRKTEPKDTFVEQIGDVIIACGIYH